VIFDAETGAAYTEARTKSRMMIAIVRKT